MYKRQGYDYSEVNEYDKAAEYYEKAVASHNDPFWVKTQLGWNLAAGGHKEEALDVYFKLLEEQPENGWVLAQDVYKRQEQDQ